MAARQNCAYVLSQTRLHHGPMGETGHFWIDAICINQQDIEERNAQVAFMGDLYRNAAQIWACVGQPDPVWDELFKYASLMEVPAFTLDTCMPRVGNGFEEPHEPAQEHWIPYHALAFLSKIEDDKGLVRASRALYNFVEREYWSRVWIYQEVILAGFLKVFILCGLDIVRLDYIKLVGEIQRRGQTHDAVDEPLRLVAKARHLLQFEKGGLWREEHGSADDLDHRLGWTQRSGMWSHSTDFIDVRLLCMDPRDHIYGASALIAWPEQYGPPEPDYNIPILDLVVDVINRLGLALRLVHPCHVDSLLQYVGQERDLKRGNRAFESSTADTAALLPPECICGTYAVPNVAIVYDLGARHQFRVCASNASGFVIALERSSVEELVHFETTYVHETDDYVSVARKIGGTRYDITFACRQKIVEGDRLFSRTPFGSKSDGLRSHASDWMLLRVHKSAYYEVVCPIAGFVHPVDIYAPGAYHGLGPFVDEDILLCLDAEDAVLDVWSKMDDLRGPGECATPAVQTRQVSLLAKTFGRSRFSSFAIMKPWSDDSEYAHSKSKVFKASKREVLRLLSLDGKHMVCVECGGLYALPKEQW